MRSSGALRWLGSWRGAPCATALAHSPWAPPLRTPPSPLFSPHPHPPPRRLREKGALSVRGELLRTVQLSAEEEDVVGTFALLELIKCGVVEG